MKKVYILLVGFMAMAFYPIDGFETTNISRLLYVQRLLEKGEKYTRAPEGALQPLECIELNLTHLREDSLNTLMTPSVDLTYKLKKLIPDGRYSVSILDMTKPYEPAYAAHRDQVGYQPGSVGKLAVLTALFTELAKIYPNSWEERKDLLCGKIVSSRYWGLGDHHTIPVYDVDKDKMVKRKVVASDAFSLYEWIDHMVSVSNNGAASIVYREAMLMSAFGKDYFMMNDEDAEAFFKDTPRDSLTRLSHGVISNALSDLGITDAEWKLGGMFTRTPSKVLDRMGGSLGTTKGLMKFFILLEQGKVVDEASSLEMKRLIYLTDRRIRYAKSPRLDNAAVYYKSGSLYKCDRSKNPSCGDYEGNVMNYMNSVIIVEQPDGRRYIVCLMSNVLNKNSAWAHMDLATKIDKMLSPDS